MGAVYQHRPSSGVTFAGGAVPAAPHTDRCQRSQQANRDLLGLLLKDFDITTRK